MRDTTERPEAVDAGTVKLVGTNAQRIISETNNLLDNKQAYEIMTKAHNPYGDSKACERIINFMKRMEDFEKGDLTCKLIGKIFANSKVVG